MIHYYPSVGFNRTVMHVSRLNSVSHKCFKFLLFYTFDPFLDGPKSDECFEL